MDKDFYLGNPNLKRSGLPDALTNEQAEEYIKCMHDPLYFAEKYIKIVHVDHGLINMQLYDYQKEILEKLNRSRKVAVLSSRQSGKTTTAVAAILHYVIFNKHKTVALLANKGAAANEILSRIQLAYEALPKWLQSGVKEWNKGSFELENGCKVLAASSSSSSIRGKSISLLYIDETAFLENWDEFYASVFPTITSGKTTKIMFTSTPNGLNHFHKICVHAKKDHDDPEWNGFEYVEVMWDRVPGRDEEWKKETIDGLNGDMEKFAQEFECAFHGSSGTLISGAKLKALVHETPIENRDGLSIYRKPEVGHNYAMTVDVSRGKGLDYSAFQVIDITSMPYRVVAKFQNNLISPIEYAEVIFRIASSYNKSSVLVEVNDIGAQVAELLHFEFEYDNVLHTENSGARGKRISAGFGKNVDAGIRTTKTVKSVGCSILKLMVEQDQLIIPDYETIAELNTFSKKGVSYEAESGKHDDLVMCLVLFAWLSDQQFFRDLTDINTITRLRERTEEEIMSSIMPFGFVNDGHDEFEDISPHYY